jgi:hypothetical protein
MCILYSNKDTNVYEPKTYSNANNIRTLYSIYNCVSIPIMACVDNSIYSIDLRSRKFAREERFAFFLLAI